MFQYGGKQVSQGIPPPQELCRGCRTHSGLFSTQRVALPPGYSQFLTASQVLMGTQVPEELLKLQVLIQLVEPGPKSLHSLQTPPHWLMNTVWVARER